MKKIISLITCILLLASITLPAYATDGSEVIYSNVVTLEDGTVITDVIIAEPRNRAANSVTATRKQTISRDDTVIGELAFRATYVYNGSMAYVSSKSVTRTDTYEGWNYKQNSFTASGGRVTLDGKLTKLLVLTTPFSMSLTCDKDGNLTTRT